MWSDEFVNQIISDSSEINIPKILFPEGDDKRILAAAEIIANKKIANPILFTKNKINGVDTYWNPDWEEEIDKLQDSANWLKENKVDAVIAGAKYTSSDVVRVGLKTLGFKPMRKRITGMFIMDTGLPEIGNNGVVIFADPIVIPNPTTYDYIEIIQGAYEIWRLLFPDVQPRAALLDFISESGQFEKINQEEIKLLKSLCPDLIFDGPLQVDAAVIPTIAAEKAPHSSLLGKANLLIFPDLKSGNIGYKLVERLGKAKAISVISGFNKVWNDLSRGCSVDDVVLVSCLTKLQINGMKVLD